MSSYGSKKSTMSGITKEATGKRNCLKIGRNYQIFFINLNCPLFYKKVHKLRLSQPISQECLVSGSHANHRNDTSFNYEGFLRKQCNVLLPCFHNDLIQHIANIQLILFLGLLSIRKGLKNQQEM